MAAGTWKWYGNALKNALKKKIDWESDAIKIMLVAAAYTPNQDSDEFASAVTNEVTGANWPAGGVALSSCTLTYTGATNVLKLDANDVSVASVTLTGAVTAVIYDSTPGTAATNPLIAYCVFDSALSPNAGPLSITFDANGIVTATPST